MFVANPISENDEEHVKSLVTPCVLYRAKHGFSVPWFSDKHSSHISSGSGCDNTVKSLDPCPELCFDTLCVLAGHTHSFSICSKEFKGLIAEWLFQFICFKLQYLLSVFLRLLDFHIYVIFISKVMEMKQSF